MESWDLLAFLSQLHLSVAPGQAALRHCGVKGRHSAGQKMDVLDKS